MWQKYDNRMNICEKVCSWFIKLKSEVNRLERKLFRKDGSKMARKLARKLFLIRRATYKIDSICISSNGTLSRKSSQSSRIFRTFFHSITKTSGSSHFRSEFQTGIQRPRPILKRNPGRTRARSKNFHRLPVRLSQLPVPYFTFGLVDTDIVSEFGLLWLEDDLRMSHSLNDRPGQSKT